jgi:hydrophobic/amphiphilic exporter-1 (mainly G- bacteria), HAE1 family
MFELYSKPLRVYFLLGSLALWGLISGLQLPVSLFPMSSQVAVSVYVPYSSLSSIQFFELYGKNLEAILQGLKVEGVGVEDLTAEYRSSGARYKVRFKWGAEPEKVIKEVDAAVQTRFAAAEESVRRSISVNSWRENSGFFALSFYSPLRSLDEIYKILDPIITPISSKISDANGVGLYNPNSKEVTITLIPERLAQFEVTTSDVQSAIQQAVQGLSGGTMKMGEKDYQIDLPKSAEGRDDLAQIRISPKSQAAVFLKDVARITVGVSDDSRKKFKTDGIESLILFAQPKDGGNVKNMSDRIMSEVERLQSQWPEDIKFKVLVNPSEFINESIFGVVREVFLAGFLAVLVLFCFIGSFKNVVTAAIEIPISLLMAFILMRITGMNLNLISLGGLALSAGMNVDASVVVLENIFRHFHGKNENMTFSEKARILIEAVKEVQLPIIAATVASLVVFMPLVFTQGLTNALLGDLAKAVIFSHGLSAVVALILVPTIRLHLLSKGSLGQVHSPFNFQLAKLENLYRRALKFFLLSRRSQLISFVSVVVLIPVLIFFVVPRLKKEIIGRPDTDWLIVGYYSPLSATPRQMESEVDALEQSLMEEFGEKINYTFVQIQGDQNRMVMLRLKNKKDISIMAARAEEIFKNTATKFYFVEQWNPSELNIPESPEVRVEISGGVADTRLAVAQDFQNELLEKNIYDRVSVTPSAVRQRGVFVRDFGRFGSQQDVLSKYEISHYLRVAKGGVYVDRIFQDQSELPIYLRFEKDTASSLAQIKALPVGYQGRLIPLGALADFSIENRAPENYRENQRDLMLVTGRLNKNNLDLAPQRKKQFLASLDEFKNKMKISSQSSDHPNLVSVVPDKVLQEALEQLKWAIALSIILIFITMVLQLGDVVQSLLVLIAIPLGFIGVILSLWIFQSSLSLNSGLGTILLNGIAVGNSIILVDFIQKIFQTGKSALDATVIAASARLRPILMTSTTTVLGMLPIAFGIGEGGKILQPLGIAVCGGLWISMLLTLFFVPALQYLYLNRREQKIKITIQQRPVILPELSQ